MNIFRPEYIQDEIERARAARDFRPTVGILAIHSCEETKEPKFLLGRSSKEHNPNIFWPIQGGIQTHENGRPEYMGSAVSRELFEEVGIGVSADFAVPLGAIRYENGKNNRKPKDGFMNGNLLIAMGVEFCESAWRRSPLYPIPVEESDRPSARAVDLDGELSEIRLLNEVDTRSVLISNVGYNPHTSDKALFFIRMIDRALESRRV